MRKILILVVIVLFCVSVKAQITATRARSEISGTAVPNAPCNPGPIWRDIYIRTTDNSEYQCTAAPNTWTKVSSGSPSTGDVVGPASATDNAVARFDLTTGKLLENSVVTIADTTGDIAGTQSLIGGAANFTLTSGTGASRTLIFRTTTSGSTPTTALTLNANQQAVFTSGTVSLPSVAIGATNFGLFQRASATIGISIGAVQAADITATLFRIPSNSVIGWSGSTADQVFDTTISRCNGAGVLCVGTTASNSLGSVLGTNATFATYKTATNCTDSAGAAACGSASAGSVVIDAAASSVVVSTTAVTADSQVFLTTDSSLGTRLGVTCNTQSSLVLGTPRVTARTAATSFTITIDAAPTTNPLCVGYLVVN